MMTKKKTSWIKVVQYGLIAPCILLLLFAFRREKTDLVLEAAVSKSAPRQEVPAISPVDPAVVTEVVGFGMRLHQATQKMQHHSGVDFIARPGEKILATADGEVIESAFDELKGNFIVIRHSQELATQYYHLLESKVTPGTMVKSGAVIGTVGSTGKYSQGPHLHYEVLKHGKAVNPKEYLPEEQRSGL